MITSEEFINATLEFNETEKRGSFYNMAVNLIDKGFELEAYILRMKNKQSDRALL